MPLSTGARLGPYEILAAIGAGGMGEVYKARDTRLDRVVAIKVLPAGATADPERRHRFELEARAASALNHRHICVLHDVGSQDGIDFLVMEYLDGQSLAQRLRKGALPRAQVLELGAQIADALASAHRHGIVHRDLKPANIMLTKSGAVRQGSPQAKLLDFGLAKLRPQPSAAAAGASALSTKSVATRPGVVMGTVPYMAPEQLEGKETDARTDLFAFGCVLYEMLTARRAFGGDSEASMISAIMTGEPAPLSTLQPLTPPALDRLVRRCLKKDPDDRWESARDVAEELRGISQDAVAPDGARAAIVGRRSRPRVWALVGGALLLVVLAGVAWLGLRSSLGLRVFGRPPTTAKLTDKDTIVLADFDNTTGDPVFDDTLKQGLSVQLEQSPFLNLLSDQRVNETLKLMGRPAGDRLTPAVTQQVCERTGSTAMLTGSIVPLGSQYVIGLKAVACATGDVLAEAQEQAADKESVLKKALDATAIRIRSRLGESLSSVQKYATPLPDATTPSLEALKAFSVGRKTAFAKGFIAALPFFQRAVELDPTFATAYGFIGSSYLNLNEVGRGADYMRKAYDLREKVSERERFLIEAMYYTSVTGELEKAAQTLELSQQTYPRDALAYVNVGYVSSFLGHWEKALEATQAALPLDPGNQTTYANLADLYMVFNRLDDAEAVFKQAEARKLEGELLLLARYWLAFLKGDAAQMARGLSAAMGKPGAEDLLLATQADTEGWYGKLEHAHELTGRAMASAQHNDARETAAGYQAEAALREAEAGNRRQARADADAAIKLAPNRDVRAMSALALARAGETVATEKLAADLDRAFPLDTLVQRYWLPAIRAAIALERQDPKRAVNLLQVANPIDLSAPTSGLTIFLCPVYVRAEAYLMLHDGKAAAAEFQQFIDHRGVVMNFPWGALARLGLARAYAMQGDTAKARTAYQDFLTLWKDADPDLPVLKAAKAEYARLK